LRKVGQVIPGIVLAVCRMMHCTIFCALPRDKIIIWLVLLVLVPRILKDAGIFFMLYRRGWLSLPQFHCMKNLFQSAIGRLRLTGFAEAVSWLLLLFIAMPLKYIWQLPQPVKVVGWAHGLLFIVYISLLIKEAFRNRWSLKKTATGCIAAFLPFGTLVFDKQLKVES
jgi:integral membrane protein